MLFKIHGLAALALLLGVSHAAVAADALRPAANPISIPSTVSAPWQEFWRNYHAWPDEPLPAADDLQGWDQANAKRAAMIKGFINPNLEQDMQLDVRDSQLGSVPVLDVRPKALQCKQGVLIYFHGGAYTFGSARLNLLGAGLLANASHIRVVSVDYTLAPRAKWKATLEQAEQVYKALLKEGYAAGQIGLFGDSAGGGLAAGLALKLRDDQLPTPGALLLWSPWADITATGDSYSTLAQAEPLLTARSLNSSAAAYASTTDQKNPYVSPVYGNFSRSFPPTLIQGGTKEIFLSHFVRLYRAIDSAGGVAKLDLYEGMPHVFQIIQPQSPEAQLAVQNSSRFVSEYLCSSSKAAHKARTGPNH